VHHRSTLVLALFAIAFTPAACGDPPGKGPKAERGYRRSEPVIAALERYRAERGSFPDSLPMLVPRYLPASALRVPAAPGENRPLAYRRIDPGYELTFTYFGPGVNECVYVSIDGKWKCGGHY